MLDIIPVYNPKNARPLNDEEQELENEMNFERYTDLIENQRNGGMFVLFFYNNMLLIWMLLFSFPNNR